MNDPSVSRRVQHAGATSVPLRSIEEVARHLGVSAMTVRRLISRGELLTHRVGRSVRIGDADLRAFLADSRGQKS